MTILDEGFIASMQRGITPLNPPKPLPELTPEQLAEGDTTEIRR